MNKFMRVAVLQHQRNHVAHVMEAQMIQFFNDPIKGRPRFELPDHLNSVPQVVQGGSKEFHFSSAPRAAAARKQILCMPVSIAENPKAWLLT